LHVVDVADEHQQSNIEQVSEVLGEIGAGEVPQLMICNKIDKLEDSAPRIDRDDEGKPVRVWVSAQDNIGTELIFEALKERLGPQMVNLSLKLPPSMGKLRGTLYQLNSVSAERIDEQGELELDIKMSIVDWNKLQKKYDNRLDNYIQ